MKLNAKPIMSLNEEGQGTAFGLAFSRRSIDKKIIKHVKKIIASEGIDKYAIVHAGNPELAERYRRIFEELIGKSPAISTDISAITTIHAGIGAVAIALTRR
jgi:fatty acid-binding protein DegV